jgi:CRISPR-associated Csx2 family protein
LAKTGKQADKLVVLGTPSSMWDALFESEGEVDSKYEDDWIELADAIRENSESPKDEESETEKISDYLTTLEEVLRDREGIDCEMRVIPYGESQDKQVRILTEMEACVQDGDTVSLDITHGLRHLPMLVVLSAMYLEVVKNVTIEGIYYGAMEMKNRHDGIAPALNLKGLLGIANWVGALKSFDKDGDYGVFAERLEEDGLTTKQTKHLKDAAFFERIFNVSQAARKLTAFRNSAPENLPGIGHLFSDTLNSRTSWAKKGNVYVRQRDMAYSFLDKKEYCRAAVFALEAFITHLCQRNNRDIGDYYQRRDTKQEFEKGKLGDTNKISDFKLLKDLRNAMAHSDDQAFSKVEVKAIMTDKNPQQRLETELKKLMKRLLP